MQIRIAPGDGTVDEKQPDDEQAVFGHAANEAIVTPTSDDETWWLPDKVDMTGRNGIWRKCGKQWSPPNE